MQIGVYRISRFSLEKNDFLGKDITRFVFWKKRKKDRKEDKRKIQMKKKRKKKKERKKESFAVSSNCLGWFDQRNKRHFQLTN